MNPIYLYTSTDGRIARRTYWIGIVIISLVGVPAVLAGFFLGGPTGAAIVNLLFLWCGFALSVKRVQDRNRHYFFVAGFFALAALTTNLEASSKTSISDKMMDPSAAPRVLVVVVSLALLAYLIFLLIDLGFLRGTVGTNKYGPDPLQQDAQQP